MNKKQSFSSPALGGSSLMVIFAVLCLTVFALLSLSTVRAGSRLSDSTAAAVSAYYEADCRAEEVLARLRAGQLPEGVSEEDGVYSYSCPISDTQELSVKVRLDGESYTILGWQAVSTALWDIDQGLDLWDGEVPG